jgi:diaminopimelate epimerase
VANKSWQTIGAEICIHPDFPQQTNVEFVRVLNPEQIEIRIFERGVGPTTSSGTGTFCFGHGGARLHELHVAAHSAGAGRRADGGRGKARAELRLTGPASLIARGEAFYA